MKNKVKHRSFAILTLLLSSATGSMAHGDVERSTGVPENLTLSQFVNSAVDVKQLENGAHLLTQSFVGGEPLQVNRRDEINEGLTYALDAYERYKNHKDWTNFLNANEEDIEDKAPFYINSTLEGAVHYKSGENGQKGKIVVAFRGTKESCDWWTNLDGAKQLDASMYGASGTVHKGFHERYMAVRQSIHDAIRVLQDKYGKDSDILVTGHSLGGATANLAAADIKNNLDLNGRLKLITFSAPRVFDQTAADSIAARLENRNIYRIVVEGDPVPGVAPQTVFDYEHTGTVVNLAKEYSTFLFGVIGANGKLAPNHDLNTIAKILQNDITIPNGPQTYTQKDETKRLPVSTMQRIVDGFAEVENVPEYAISAVVNNIVAPVLDRVIAPVVSAGYNYVVKPVVTAVSAVVNGASGIYHSADPVARIQNIVTEEAGRIYRDAKGNVSDAYNAVADAASNANKAFWGYLGY